MVWPSHGPFLVNLHNLCTSELKGPQMGMLPNLLPLLKYYKHKPKDCNNAKNWVSWRTCSQSSTFLHCKLANDSYPRVNPPAQPSTILYLPCLPNPIIYLKSKYSTELMKMFLSQKPDTNSRPFTTLVFHPCRFWPLFVTDYVAFQEYNTEWRMLWVTWSMIPKSSSTLALRCSQDSPGIVTSPATTTH